PSRGVACIIDDQIGGTRGVVNIHVCKKTLHAVRSIADGHGVEAAVTLNYKIRSAGIAGEMHLVVAGAAVHSGGNGSGACPGVPGDSDRIAATAANNSE